MQWTQSDALGQTAYYAYDPAGNLSASTDPHGRTTYFGYDRLDRQTRVAYPAGPAHDYAYDAAGNLTRATDGEGASCFAYDAADRLTSAATAQGHATYFAYDPANRRVALTVAPGRTAYYAYDAAGNRTRVTSPHGESTYFAYDPAGSLVYKRLEPGAETYYTYDAAGRVKTIRNALASGPPTCYFTYDYDAASRVTSLGREDGTVVYYAYDAADRLLEENWKQGASSVYAFAWDYDAVGNRVYESRDLGAGATETYFQYDAANALTHAHALPAGTHAYYAYDKRGNCTLLDEPDGATYFSYNDADLVTHAHLAGGAHTYFYYDGLLRRYAMEHGGQTTYFQWDTNGLNLLSERDASGTVTANVYLYQEQVAGDLLRLRRQVHQVAYAPCGDEVPCGLLRSMSIRTGGCRCRGTGWQRTSPARLH